MNKIIVGNTIATPYPRPDWNQTDETKADYIKNKPSIEDKINEAIEKVISDAKQENKTYTDTAIQQAILDSWAEVTEP